MQDDVTTHHHNALAGLDQAVQAAVARVAAAPSSRALSQAGRCRQADDML